MLETTSTREDILEWIAQEQEDVAEEKFDTIAGQRGWAGQCTRSHEVFKILIHGVEESHRWNASSMSETEDTKTE